jgi:hypothetical protein
MLTVAALKKFGLLEDQGSGDKRQARLTPLALQIVLDERPDSEERRAAIREAALNPTIHAELWDEFGGSLPSDVNLRYKLRGERGFTDSAANELIEEFRRTIAFAGLEDLDNADPRPENKGSLTPPTAVREATPPAGSHVVDRGQPSTPALTRDPSIRGVSLPLSATTWVTIEAPFPLSVDEWDQMMHLLNAMKPGLTEPAPNPPTLMVRQAESSTPSLTAEAQELLKKVDEGGVPAYITDNLRRVAQENGVVVATDTTPNEIIEELQQMALDEE